MGKIPNNRFAPFFILGLILIVAISLRLYKFENYGFFADQARDAFAVHDWFASGKIPLQGPATSIGTFHLGPLYYYLITPFVLIFNFNPIGAVYFELFEGLMLVTLGFILFYKLIDLNTAIIFALLITFSPLAISLSKGSWNPHPVLLITLFLVFALMQFIKTELLRYVFISAFLVGLGIQLHYTFLTNGFSLLAIIILFKKKLLTSYKLWLLFMGGFLIPLAPFLIGQFLNGFTDLNNLWLYINQSGTQQKIFILKSFLDRLSFPFSIFFPFENLPWFAKLIAPGFYLFILGNVILIAFLKTHLSLFTKIVIILFFLTLIQSIFIQIPFYYHYNYTAATLVVFMITIYISYLRHYAKLKFIWLSVFAVFILWEIFLIPDSYKVIRTAKVVTDISEVILTDYKHNRDSLVGIFVISPATLSPGLEYRYMLEKKGLKTFSSSRPATADYVVVEGDAEASFSTQENNRLSTLIKEFKFDDGGTLVKYAKLYKVEKTD